MHINVFRSISQAILHRASTATAVVALASLTACSSGPKRVTQPEVDASSAGSAAIEQYDADQNGTISGAELDKVPAFKSALPQLDTNHDGGVSADEVTAAIQHWQEIPLGVMSMGFKLTYDGAPVEGATVTFEPEEFLGSEVKAAVTTTDMFGTGGPTVPKEERQDATTPPGVQMGFYKVKISKLVNGKETVPAKYNEQTIFGQHMVPDNPEILNRRVVYAMTSK